MFSITNINSNKNIIKYFDTWYVFSTYQVLNTYQVFDKYKKNLLILLINEESTKNRGKLQRKCLMLWNLYKLGKPKETLNI